MFRWREGQRPFQPHAETGERGHGRIERRRLVAQAVRPQEVSWPGARQVFLLERWRCAPRGHWSEQILCGVTSLPPQQAGADELLHLIREHWGIENRLFYVRDVTLGEDTCRVRTRAGPHNLAITRNLTIHLLRQAGHANLAAAVRRHAAHPAEALALLET